MRWQLGACMMNTQCIAIAAAQFTAEEGLVPINLCHDDVWGKLLNPERIIMARRV